MGARMLRKRLAVAVFLLFVGMSVVPSTAVQELIEKTFPLNFDGNTLYVGGSGPNNYTKIQDAIDNASDGDTVFVYDDSSPYYENINIDKSIDLIGEDRNTTVIDSDNSKIVNIISNHVTFYGFKLIGDGWGIKISENNVEIRDNNIFTENSIDIELCSDNTIINNIVESESRGIILTSSRSNSILGNVINSHMLGGIVLSSSDENIVSGNTIMNTEEIDLQSGDIHLTNSNENIISDNILIAMDNEYRWGIKIDYSGNDNIIENNTITGFNSSGIGIFAGKRSEIQNNDINECNSGISIAAKNNNIFTNNIVNCNRGILLFRSKSNKITNNNFMDNEQNAYFHVFCFQNIWNGNYWGEPKNSPYIIRGSLFLFIPWFNFDWNPASEPYEI